MGRDRRPSSARSGGDDRPCCPISPTGRGDGASALDLDEAEALVRAGARRRARDRCALAADRRARRLDARRTSCLAATEGHRMTGRVVLVGAGPGDPELITVRGAERWQRRRRRLRPARRRRAPRPGAPHAERIYVGKEPGRQAMRQEEIDALLVARALAGNDGRSAEGRRSVRVRARRRGDARVRRGRCPGGGRAGHHERGRRSGRRRHPASRTGGGALLRRRDGFHRARRRHGRSGPHGDRHRHPRGADGGRQARRDLRHVGGGRAERADEPAAIVQWAWTSDQRTVAGTLADLPALASASSVGPPATLVVGGVADLAGSDLRPSQRLTDGVFGSPAG